MRKAFAVLLFVALFAPAFAQREGLGEAAGILCNTKEQAKELIHRTASRPGAKAAHEEAAAINAKAGSEVCRLMSVAFTRTDIEEVVKIAGRSFLVVKLHIEIVYTLDGLPIRAPMEKYVAMREEPGAKIDM